MRPIAIPLCLALAAVPAARAAEAPPDDLDALSLADKAPAPATKPPQKLRLFVEGAVGEGQLLGSSSTFHPTRASLDLRFDDVITPGLRGVLSDRLDIVRSRGVPPGDDVNTLPDFDFTNATSIASMNASALTSSRKLDWLMVLPACDFV